MTEEMERIWMQPVIV